MALQSRSILQYPVVFESKNGLISSEYRQCQITPGLSNKTQLRNFAESSRLVSSFHGLQIEQYPAKLKRNEKRHNRMSIRSVLEKVEGTSSDSEKEESKVNSKRALLLKQQADLAAKIASGEFTVASKRYFAFNSCAHPVSKACKETQGPLGRNAAKVIAMLELRWRAANPVQMPTARGDVRAIIGQPFFVPLYNLFKVYGGVFRLSFGPKQFAIVSDPVVAKHILKDNARSYSKGILAEILEFIMGTGLIPADGEIWFKRRRAIVPSLHRKYVAAMMNLFGECTERLCTKLAVHAKTGQPAEMESLFSRVTLDVIGKAVFNYDFDSLSKDTGITEAVYVVLREAEVRSTSLFPYWKIPPLRILLPSQRKVSEALVLINTTLDELIGTCKRMVKEEGEEFYEEYVNEQDPSILRFLMASGDEVSSKQLRDDLMTMLVAGHETSAAVLTWTFYLLAQHPQVTAKLQAEVDAVLGDRRPGLEEMAGLKYTRRVINEAMRLYPQPPVLIRRALEDDYLGGFPIKRGQDIFISVWNLHRNPKSWERHEDFWPERWDINGPDPNEVSQGFSYLPFGGGPRKCVGDVFATYELIVAVAMTVRQFDFQMAPGAPEVEMETGATIHTTNGLLMSVTARTRVPVIPVYPSTNEELRVANNA